MSEKTDLTDEEMASLVRMIGAHTHGIPFALIIQKSPGTLAMATNAEEEEAIYMLENMLELAEEPPDARIILKKGDS